MSKRTNPVVSRPRTLAACLLAALCVGVLSLPSSASARPKYKSAFEKTYGEKVEEKITCNVCHGKSKKMVSEYGKALGEALGEKNVKDEEKITESLKAIEEKGDVEGKNYGELLEEGTLPPPYEG